jgi:Uma2 family endonuclease
MSAKTEATIEDLYRVPDNGKAEIVNGEVVLMSPTGQKPSRAAFKISLRLYEYELSTGSGLAVSDNAGFKVDLPNRRSFSPGAAFYVGKDRGMKFFESAPLFAAEVRSESDYGPAAELDIKAKISDYFAAGTLVVVPHALARLTGSVPTASFTVTKLRWLAENEPDAAARTARVMLPHDWLTWRLGDRAHEPTTDRGDASGTGYFSPATGRWLPEMAEAALGKPAGLPRLAAPAEVVARTPAGVALSAGTGDNMGAALGLGLGLGEVVVSIGTSGTAYAVAAEPAADRAERGPGVVRAENVGTGAALGLIRLGEGSLV